MLKILFCFFLLLNVAVADSNYKEIKQGPVFGAGLNISVYTFPVQFTGVTKKKVDDTATTIGPSFHAGYDFLLTDHFLLGFRLEGLLADNAGMNEHRNKKRFEKLSGKSSQFSAAVRAGYVHEYNYQNLVEDNYLMVAEYFFEAGLGTGKNNYIKEYSYNDGTINEYYKDKLNETFNSAVLALGVNVTNRDGGFCELKVMQTRFVSNKARFRGEESINGGSLQPISKNVKDSKPDPLTSFILTIGHHF